MDASTITLVIGIIGCVIGVSTFVSSLQKISPSCIKSSENLIKEVSNTLYISFLVIEHINSAFVITIK